MDVEKVKRVLGNINNIFDLVAVKKHPIADVWGHIPEIERQDIKDVMTSLNTLIGSLP